MAARLPRIQPVREGQEPTEAVVEVIMPVEGAPRMTLTSVAVAGPLFFTVAVYAVDVPVVVPPEDDRLSARSALAVD